MVVKACRSGGRFYGCSKWPKCGGWRNYRDGKPMPPRAVEETPKRAVVSKRHGKRAAAVVVGAPIAQVVQLPHAALAGELRELAGWRRGRGF